jgi:hypothetical protein
MSLQKIDTYKSLTFRPCEFQFLLIGKIGDEMMPIRAVKNRSEIDALIREIQDAYGLKDFVIWESNKWNKLSDNVETKSKPESISLTKTTKRRKSKKLDIKLSSSRPIQNDQADLNKKPYSSKPVQEDQALSQEVLDKIVAKRKGVEPKPAPPKSILKPSQTDVPAYISEIYKEDTDSDED